MLLLCYIHCHAAVQWQSGIRTETGGVQTRIPVGPGYTTGVIKSNSSQSRDLSCCSHTWKQDAFPLLSAPGWACGEAVTSSYMLPVPRYPLHAGIGTAVPQAQLGSRTMVALRGQPGASARTSAGGLKVHLIESLCRGVCFANRCVFCVQCTASVRDFPLGWKLLGNMSNYWRGEVALLKWILILSVFKSNLDLEQNKRKIMKCPFLPLGCGPWDCFCCVGSCGLSHRCNWIHGSSQICHLCTKQSQIQITQEKGLLKNKVLPSFFLQQWKQSSFLCH